MEPSAPTLVLGIGNILLRDEGVGVRLIEEMRQRPVPEGVELFDGGTFGIDLMDTIASRRKVIVVDAVDAEGKPGTIFKFGGQDLAARGDASLSLHDVGLLETLLMARQLGCEPKEVVIFGIKPKTIRPGLKLSREVAAAVPKVVELVMEELRRGAE